MSTPIKREAGQEQPHPAPVPPPPQQQQQRPPVDRPVIAAAPPPPQQQQQQVIEPVRWKWMSVDSDLFPDVSVPVIMRGPSDEAYISVRITERTVLMRFHNELSAEAIAYGSLTSYPSTPAECNELNEINEVYVDRLYGTERFDLATEKLVKWKEFMEFFAILKRTCRLRTMPTTPQVPQSNRAPATNASAIQPPTFPQFPAVNPNPALRVSSGANNSTIHASLRGASTSVASPNRAAQQIPSIRTTTSPVNTTVFNPPNTTQITRPPQQEITPVVATTSSGYNVISTPNGYIAVPTSSPLNLNKHHLASRSVSQPPSQSSPPPQQIQRSQAVNSHLHQLQEMQQLNHLQPRPHPMSAGLVSNQHYPHMYPQQQQQSMPPPPPSSNSPHHLIQLQHHINMQNIQKQQMIQHHLNQQQQMSQSPPSAQFFPNPNQHQHTAANVSIVPPPYVASPHRSAPSSPRSHSNGPPSSSSPGALNPPFNSFPHGYMQQQQQSPQMSNPSTMMSSPPTGNSANQSIHQIRPHSVAANIYPPGHHVSPSLYSFPHVAPHLHHPPPAISGYSPPSQQQQHPSSILPPPPPPSLHPPPSHASMYNQATAQLQALQHQQNLNNPALRHHLMGNPTPPLTPSPNPNLVVAANPSSNSAEQILRILGAQQQQQLQQSHNYNQYANNNRIIAPQMQPQTRTTAQHDQRTTSNIIAQPTTTSANNNQQINTSSADEDDIIWLDDDQPPTKPKTSSTIVKKIETSAPVKSENKTVVMASNSNTSTNEQTQANTRTSTKDRGPMNYLKINTVVLPFINLEREKAVRLFELIPGSTQFVSAYQLAITGVIPHDLIDDRDRLRANFKSLQMATIAQIDEINKLTRELLAAFNPDAGPRLFLEQLDPGDKRHFHLVNVIELILAYSSAPMFIREMSLHDTTLAKFNEQSFNFRDVLQMRGGIIQVIAPSTDGKDTSIKILPFVEIGDLLLIKDSIRNYLEELVALRHESNADEPKINLSKLVIPMTEQNEEQRLVLRTFAEFFQLLLVYVAIPTRISYKMTLINVKPLLNLFPDRLFIICRYTENFPIDWRASLENIKSNIPTNSEGERINSRNEEQPIITPTATATTTAVRRSSRNERRDIDDANQMTIELTSSSSEDNNPPEVVAATNNNNQMTIELTSTSSDEDRRENVDQPPPMETDENKVTSTTTTLNVDVTNQQQNNANTTTTIISPQPVTTTTTTTTTTATSRFESSVSLSPASIDSPEPTSQFVEKSSSSPPKSKTSENTVKSGRTFSISILHQQQKEKEKEKEKEAAKTVKIVTVERFTEDELKIRPRRRCYSAIYVCRATNTSKDFSDWFKAEKWPKAERRMLNQHQQQQVSSSEEKGEVVSSPPPCDHYLRRILHGANPWEVQQSVVNLIQGHNRLAKTYKEKEERESVNKNKKPRAASVATEPTSTEDMRPSITSTTTTTNKETEEPRIKQPESSKPCEMNWEETGGGSEEPIQNDEESKTTAVTTTTPKKRGRKRYSSQQSSSTTSTTNANTKKRKRGSRRRFTMKTPKRRRASHETVSYMSRSTTTATTRNNSTTSESDTSSGGSLKDFIAKDDELEYETAEEDLYSSFPDDNEQDEWATAAIGKQGTESSKGIVVTLRRKSKNNPPPPPLKPNIACIQKDNDLYTSEDPAVDEREILKKMGIFKVAKITDKKLSVTQILAIQRQLKETSNGDGSKRQFAKKTTSTKTTTLPTTVTKNTSITNNKRTVPAKKQTTTTTTTSPTKQNQRKASTSTSTTATTKQTSKVKSEPTTSKIEKPVSPQSPITISSSSSAASVKPTAATTKTKTTSSTNLFHDEDSNSLPELAF